MLTTAIPPAVRSIVAGSVGRLRGFGGTLASNPAPSVATTISVTPATASFALGDTQQFTATVLDQYGQPITQGGGGFGVPVIAWSSDSVNVTIDSTGLATGAAYGTATITATYQTLTGTAVATVQQPTKLAMVQQPAGATTGSALTTQPIVTLQDALSASDGESGRSVTVALGSGSGTLAGTTTIATNGAGQAVFTDLVITATSPPSNCTLTFSSSGLTGVTSASFTVSSNVRTFSTAFQTVQNPLSESGSWINGGTQGLDWHDCRVVSTGFCCGTQDGTTAFTDSVALLTGTWANNQEVQATTINNGATQGSIEYELWLRGSISAHSITGYEIDFGIVSTFLTVARWNGPLGNFTVIPPSVTFAAPRDAVTEQVLRARMVGNTISVFQNNVELARFVDSTYAGGAPGIGFYRAGSPSNAETIRGFSAFSATDL